MILELKNVTVTNIEKKIILKNINLNFKKEGKIVFLVGASGSGKTTLLEVILSSLKEGKELQQGGEVSIGTDNVLYISQNSRLSFDPYFTLREYFDMLDSSIETLDFSLCKNEIKGFPFQHSDGQLQNLQLVLSEIYQPDLLLIDEPTSSLDQELRKKVKEIIIKMKKAGKTIIITTHDFQFVEGFKDNVDSNDLIIVLKPHISDSDCTSIDLISSIKSFFNSEISKDSYAFKLLKFYEFLKQKNLSFEDFNKFVNSDNRHN